MPTCATQVAAPVHVTDCPYAVKLLPLPFHCHASCEHAVPVFQQPLVVNASALNGARPPPGVQPMGHTPFVQLAPFAHTLPQPPQLFLSVLMLISQPLAAMPSQSRNPALHMPMPQVELLHAALALAIEHTLLQPPQLPGSNLVLVHMPLQL